MTTAGGPAGEDLRGRSTSARAPALPSTGVLSRRRLFLPHLVSFVLVNVLLDVDAGCAYGRPARAGSHRCAAL
jgi:hypothetical protein